MLKSENTTVTNAGTDGRNTGYRVPFDLFDTDGDGLINVNELDHILRSFGIEKSENELQDMHNEVDKDNDGLIDFYQFISLVNKRSQDFDVFDEYLEACKFFDLDMTGKLEISHLKHILMSLGENLEESQIDEMLQDADLQNDGYIEYKSFVKLMLLK